MDAAEREAIFSQPALDAPDGIVPNFDYPPNDNGLATFILIICVTVTTLVVLLRIHSWLFVLNTWTGRLEAVLVLCGYASYIGWTIMLFRIRNGLGWWVHLWDVHVRDTIDFSYSVYVAGLLYNAAIAPVKVAILVEWMRIFSPRIRNAFFWTCQIALWVNVVYYFAATITEALQCLPQNKIWDPTVLEGHCLNTRANEVTTASINVVSDAIILLTPQRIIWKLQLSIKKKIGLATVFAVGLFGVLSAILRLRASEEYLKEKDSSYAVSPVAFWAMSELTSVFLVYGMPAVPGAVVGLSTSMGSYYARLTKLSFSSRRTTRQGSEPHAGIGDSPWSEVKGPASKHQPLGDDDLPLHSLDVRSERWGKLPTTSLSTTTQTMDVLRTVEIRSNEQHIDISAGETRDSGDEVLLHQHPWIHAK